VSSYAQLYLRGVEIFAWRNEIDPTFLFLFTADEVHRGPFVEGLKPEPAQEILLTAPVAVLRDRLDVLGIGRTAVEAAFKEHVERTIEVLAGLEIIEGFGGLENLPSTYGENRQRRIGLLKGITLDDWVGLLAVVLKSPEKHERIGPPDPTSLPSLLEFWERADPRFLLAAVLLGCEPDEEISLDVSELLAGGWIDRRFDPQRVAIEHFSYSLESGRPPVVITEGSTDSHFLQAAIRLRFPHLTGFINFFDFASGAEGGAGAAVRTLKSFAAAGISNRVVLLLDNDSAAHDAVRALKGVKLPPYYSVLHYPETKLAAHYPALGPTGLAEMNVNGLAGSIELYLGIDVLTDSSGKLRPVQWRSYIESVKAYQGEVTDKADVHKRFREKVKVAETNPICIDQQDWSGLDAIIRALIISLRS